jgi:hypothetical protein
MNDTSKAVNINIILISLTKKLDLKKIFVENKNLS